MVRDKKPDLKDKRLVDYGDGIGCMHMFKLIKCTQLYLSKAVKKHSVLVLLSL